MSTISFVPRSVKRRKIHTPKLQDQVSTGVDSKSTPTGACIASEDHASQTDENKATEVKEKDLASVRDHLEEDEYGPRSSVHNVKPSKGPDLEELALLVWLALSDYALWSDTDLRRKIDWASDVYDEQEVVLEEGNETVRTGDDHGYIPLAYLLRQSPVFLLASSSSAFSNQPETVYVKALRTHASHLVDVRLIISDDGPFSHTSHWSKHPSPSTGYEVRRKSVGDLIGNYGKSDWDKLTIYVENIPNQYRSLPGIAKFITSLLPPSGSPITRVQNVAFSPHHNDKPGSLPTCKGFALVALSSAEDTQLLLDEWPWDAKKHESEEDPNQELEGTNPPKLFRREAQKFGLRCLSKARWEELKAEYLLYRQQLVEELNAENEAQERINRTLFNAKNSRPEQERITKRSQVESEPQTAGTSDTEHLKASLIHAGSSFPSGCLAFVRNVHPETNKTTLRSLFSQAWKVANNSAAVGVADGLDYVDYLKGLDTCHVRLRSQSHAEQFVHYFSTHPTTQTLGLDGVGNQLSSPDASHAKSDTVAAELVLGKREELYWEKIPEKVRRQAVEKSMQTTHGVNATGGKKDGVAGAANEKIDKKRRRK